MPVDCEVGARTDLGGHLKAPRVQVNLVSQDEKSLFMYWLYLMDSSHTMHFYHKSEVFASECLWTQFAVKTPSNSVTINTRRISKPETSLNYWGVGRWIVEVKINHIFAVCITCSPHFSFLPVSLLNLSYCCLPIFPSWYEPSLLVILPWSASPDLFPLVYIPWSASHGLSSLVYLPRYVFLCLSPLVCLPRSVSNGLSPMTCLFCWRSSSSSIFFASFSLYAWGQRMRGKERNNLRMSSRFQMLGVAGRLTLVIGIVLASLVDDNPEDIYEYSWA